MHPEADADALVTIVSVRIGNDAFLRRNVDLTRAINRGPASRWIVVDNELDGAADLGGEGVDVIPGVERPQVRDLGSLHHARALEKGLGFVDTRFVLLLDPDFYAIRKNWIAEVTAHALAAKLSFFGAPWHPRWFYQYRGFPAVHFLLIDLETVPARDIDLKPAMHEDRWWQWINSSPAGLPPLLRDTLKIQRCRDTGWQLHRRYRDNPGTRVELLKPYFEPPVASRRYRWEQRLAPAMPSSWMMFPPRKDGLARESFLSSRFPAAHARKWEEFTWRGEPFAVHLRDVGRKMMGVRTADDLSLLDDLLDSYGRDVRVE